MKNIWVFSGLKCRTKVKSGQTTKYILVGTVTLTFMLMLCLSCFSSSFLKVRWLCGCILPLSALLFLLLYPFSHQQKAVYAWFFSSVLLASFYRFRPIKPVTDCWSSPRRTLKILNTSCALRFLNQSTKWKLHHRILGFKALIQGNQ